MTTLSEASRAIPEKLWQRTVIECFRVQGWRVWHDTVAYRSDAGWPDLVCVHPRHGVVFCELKAESGRLSPAQEAWRDDLIAAGQSWFLFKPSDWLEVVAVANGAIRRRERSA